MIKEVIAHVSISDIPGIGPTKAKKILDAISSYNSEHIYETILQVIPSAKIDIQLWNQYLQEQRTRHNAYWKRGYTSSPIYQSRILTAQRAKQSPNQSLHRWQLIRSKETKYSHNRHKKSSMSTPRRMHPIFANTFTKSILHC